MRRTVTTSYIHKIYRLLICAHSYLLLRWKAVDSTLSSRMCVTTLNKSFIRPNPWYVLLDVGIWANRGRGLPLTQASDTIPGGAHHDGTNHLNFGKSDHKWRNKKNPEQIKICKPLQISKGELESRGGKGYSQKFPHKSSNILLQVQSYDLFLSLVFRSGKYKITGAHSCDLYANTCIVEHKWRYASCDWCTHLLCVWNASWLSASTGLLQEYYRQRTMASRNDVWSLWLALWIWNPLSSIDQTAVIVNKRHLNCSWQIRLQKWRQSRFGHDKFGSHMTS